MASIKKVETCIAFLAILIASTASIPIDANGQLNVVETVESREDMMLRYRLPNNTIPRLYKIRIEPNMEDTNFMWIGEISIDIEVLQATPILTLHAYKNLIIDENFTELVDANDTKLKPISQSRDDEVEFLKLKFDYDIPVGNYSLNFKYEGEDVQNFVGFYRSSFNNPNDPVVAGTHFEATTARRAFPCWDEPSFKARFRMSIKHFPNYTAVSNMPDIESIETADGKVLTTFDTTPIMSTYLLTFVIANYENLSHGNASLWADKDSMEEVKHVLELSPKIVDFMEKYTGFSYGCPRIGAVLMPIYTAAATEHWGLVTYGNGVLKFNRRTDSMAREDVVNLLIAHELAHSWFGNRVSPVWWDDLWLNEAFAAYFQYYIIDELFDNWDGMELFVWRNNYDTTFEADHEDSIPIRWTPITNTEIRRLFGTMTYRKGSAIVHMFRNVLSDDVFRAGIQKYLAKHSFGAAVANDLTRAFQEAHDEGVNAGTPLNVTETMTSWLVQSGYPIINVTRNYTTGITKVAQESATAGKNSTKKWWIPLTYATKSDVNFSSTVPSRWISDKEDSVAIDGIDKDDWVIFNVKSSGYYRINYDEENWNRIADYLNTDNYKNIHVSNRVQLISDAIYMIKHDPERYYGIFYKLTKYLSREVEYLPWRAAKEMINRLHDAISGDEVYGKTFKKYVMDLMNSLIEKVGFEEQDDDNHMTILARADIVAWACVWGHPGCSEFAAEKFLEAAENGTDYRLHPDTDRALLCAALRGLNKTEAMQFIAWAQGNEKSLLTRNLGCTENHDIQRYFLDNALTKNSSDSAVDIGLALDHIIFGSEENFNFAVEYFLENHEAMKNLSEYGRWTPPFKGLVRTMANQVKTASRLETFNKVLRLDAFLAAEEIDKKSMLEMAQANVAKSDELVGKFRNVWDQLLSADNTINNSDPESR